MKRMIALLLIWTAVAASAQTPEESQSRRKESEAYESPVLSLLLLPVKVLMKIASALAPNETDEASRGPRASGDSSK